MSHSLQVTWPSDAIAVLTFSDPARGNQLCWAAIDALGDQLKQCREAGARVVVLASGLAGHWLEHAWLRDLSNGVQGREQTGSGAGWFAALAELTHDSVVSIAAVSGDSSGGGAELGWACDLRIAESQAHFSQPEIDMGLTTGIGGSSRLARLAGRATAAEMVLTGAPVSAQRLYDLGAINRVVAEGQALPAALEWARLLAQKSPDALAGLKRILAVNDAVPLAEALNHEQKVFQTVLVGERARDGMERAQARYDQAQRAVQADGAGGIDPDALRDKYRRERDKRLRAEGNEQYLEVRGDFAHFLNDPHADPGFARAPLADNVEVLIVGGGLGGLLCGARLRQAGIASIRIVDPAADFGGTWYWNRYPGIACDIESYTYLPLLEETGYMPSEKYASGAEILAHCRAIARKFDLYRDTCFQTCVETLRWDDAESCWHVSTNRQDSFSARYVCLATGPLNRPKLPGIPGIDAFQGHAFHASRWDYRYTGGDSMGGLTGLADKRVGIIGTGATAVQCVPLLGESAAHLYVFQRTPSSIDVKNNPPTDPQWAASLPSGWQRQRMKNFNALVSGVPQAEDLVRDGWTDLIGKLLFGLQQNKDGDLSPAGIARAVELADFEKMEEIRARVDEIVKDARTAEALKPYYRQFCKRPCFHNEYLGTFNRPNVTLVDTAGRGVDRITASGVEVQGREYALDCLIYATGFEVGTDYSRRAGIQVVGRDGNSLAQAWSAGVRTLHGMHVNGFPNCFIMNNTQAGFTANYPHLLDEQAKHIAYLLAVAADRGCTRVEATPQGEAYWVQQCIDKARDTGDFLENCTPGYYNNEGRVGERSAQNGFYGGGSIEYFRILGNWRAQGDMQGMALR